MNISKNYFGHFNPQRYNQPFFVNQTIQQSIKEKGYCIMDLLDENDLFKLRDGFEQMSKSVKGEFGKQFWPSGRHESAEIRNLAKINIEAVVPEKLATIFVQDSYTFIGGTYLVKPPSENSALNPHQDSAHVNELDYFSVYAWIPLQDVDDKNGAVKVLPGSHQIDIKQRSLNVLWVLESHIKLLEEYMISLPMKAGQVLFFDSALIHSSPPNLTNQYRVAVNYYIHNQSSPFIHYYSDKGTPKGQVEMYAVTPEFYYSEDFESKPSSKYPFIGYQKQFIKYFSSGELRDVLDILSDRKKSWFSEKLKLIRL